MATFYLKVNTAKLDGPGAGEEAVGEALVEAVEEIELEAEGDHGDGTYEVTAELVPSPKARSKDSYSGPDVDRFLRKLVHAYLDTHPIKGLDMPKEVSAEQMAEYEELLRRFMFSEFVADAMGRDQKREQAEYQAEQRAKSKLPRRR